MTLSLPSSLVDDPAAQQNFEALRRQVPDATAFLQLLVAGTHQVAFGVQNVSWTASQTSANTTVTHGLGTTPIAVLVTPNSDSNGGGSVQFFAWVNALTTTTFKVQAFSPATSQTATNPVYWLAVS